MDSLLTQLMHAAAAGDQDLRKRCDPVIDQLMGAELAANSILEEIRSAGDKNLEAEWEAAKAACRAQQEKVEISQRNQGIVEESYRTEVSAVRSTQFALKDFDENHKVTHRWASAAELAAIEEERATLVRAVEAAEARHANATEQLTWYQALHRAELEALNKLAAIEEQLRKRLELAADPDHQQWNDLGLLSNGKPFGSSLPLTHPS